MKSIAPSRIASTAVAMVPCADTTSTVASGSSSRSRAHELDAVHRHHAEVGHDHVGRLLPVGEDRLGAPLDGEHLVAEPREGDGHALAERVVVVGDEDAGHHGSRESNAGRPEIISKYRSRRCDISYLPASGAWLRIPGQHAREQEDELQPRLRPPRRPGRLHDPGLVDPLAGRRDDPVQRVPEARPRRRGRARRRLPGSASRASSRSPSTGRSASSRRAWTRRWRRSSTSTASCTRAGSRASSCRSSSPGSSRSASSSRCTSSSGGGWRSSSAAARAAGSCRSASRRRRSTSRPTRR